MDRTERACRSGRRLALAMLIATVGVAGCGGSSKPKLSKNQFLARANAICRSGNAKTNAQGAALGNSPSRAQIVKLVQTKFVPEIQSQITAIRALAVQTADKSKLTSMIDLAQADLDKIKSNPLALVSGSGKSSPFADFATQAHAYGMTECAPTS